MKICAQLVELISINQTIVLDIRYATKNNFTKKIVYPLALLFLQREVALALDAVQKDLRKLGLGLKIFDGYRPLTIQKMFWKLCPDERYVAHPDKGSNHNRGTAADVSLIDLTTKTELLMPSEFDDFSERACRHYPFTPPPAKHNSRLLEEIMAKHAFIGKPTEWWHFDWENDKQYPILDIPFEKLIMQKI
ncbi:MAG: M15 family metallopeptidase [Candidatus Babeliaceae bacterium]|nr:M15 family metallopeptidase [Candidatus Babeliaceae bacterium]